MSRASQSSGARLLGLPGVSACLTLGDMHVRRRERGAAPPPLSSAIALGPSETSPRPHRAKDVSAAHAQRAQRVRGPRRRTQSARCLCASKKRGGDAHGGPTGRRPSGGYRLERA